MMDTSNIIFASITALALVGGFIANRASAARDLVEAATGLLAPLQERIRLLEADRDSLARRVTELEPLVPKVKELEHQTTALELWGQSLAEQVRNLGGVPIPFEEFLAQVIRGNRHEEPI